MTIRSTMAMPGIAVDRGARGPAFASPRAAIASPLVKLRTAWMRLQARRRLGRSIAHLDDRLLADIGLGPEDLGFAERIARRSAAGGILGWQ